MNDKDLIEQMAKKIAREYGSPFFNTELAEDVLSFIRSQDNWVSVPIQEVIDELRNRKGFRHWWDNYEAQDDVMECLEERINKPLPSPP